MYKNSQGETVSAEQMQIWADNNGMSIEAYAAEGGYTLVAETTEVDEGKTDGVETPEKKTTPVAAPSRASMIRNCLWKILLRIYQSLKQTLLK